MQISSITDLLYSIISGCCEDEFQQKVFENPDMSIEEMNQLHSDLYAEYLGFPMPYEWVEIHHHFETPFYYISYATSALSALDLWFLYLDRPREAKGTYLELSALSLSMPYMAAVEETGLRDIFEPETIPALSETLEEYLDGRPISYGEQRKPVQLLRGHLRVLVGRRLKLIVKTAVQNGIQNVVEHRVPVGFSVPLSNPSRRALTGRWERHLVVGLNQPVLLLVEGGFLLRQSPVAHELVRLRAEQAQWAGYDDYAEYAYEALYTRDYGLEDAARPEYRRRERRPLRPGPDSSGW